MKNCRYCGVDLIKTGSHERSCKRNPNWVKRKGGNQFTKAREEGSPVPKISKESSDKMLNTRRKNGTLAFTEERKLNMSKAMKLAVEKYPESFSSSNRGRVKHIEYNGVKFQGMWELDFYKWCEENDIQIIRNDLWFDYEWNGKRKYNPDFFLPDYNLFVEVKGYETERDRCKWKSVKNLLVIKKAEIAQIRSNDYCLQRY